MAEAADRPVHPVVSVIICHHQGQLIEACLDSLQVSVGVSFEVFVMTSDVAYHRAAHTAGRQQPPHWRSEAPLWVCYCAGGPAHKRNVGAQYAKGSVLVFLDDDTEVSPYTLWNFSLGLQQRPAAGMLFARIYNMERRSELDDCGSWLTPTGFLYARASHARISHDELLQPVRCLASKSAGCAIRRDSFRRAGGFDASYFILGEETDLAWRVWLQGEEVWYWPHAVLWHAFNTSAKPVTDYYTLERIHAYGSRNYVSLLLTNLGTLRLWTTLPIHLLAWGAAALGFLVRGQHQRARLVLRGLWEALWRLPATLRKRRRVQRTRHRSDRELMRLVLVRPAWDYYPRRLAQYIWNGLHG